MKENENSTIESVLAEIPINSISKKALMESSKWGKLIAIANLITALMLVLVVVNTIFNNSGNNFFEWESGKFMAIAIFTLMVSTFIIPAVFFWLFATNIKSSLTNQDASTFADAIFHLRSLYKFFGVLILVIFASFILLVLAVKLGLL